MCKRDVSVRTWDPRDESKTKDGKVTHMILQVATANELCNFGQNVHRNKRREGAAQLDIPEGGGDVQIVQGVGQNVHQRDENKIKKGKVTHSNLQVASVNELCKCEGCQSERGINVTKTKQKTGR
eukprot:TRINITY_DN1685_c0_g1_i9.p1 TRINITY_DN1685_c0_g1~~TRINITY_DN1685_c0_g1_i9.p1  ORF type:complete len:125 (+),score=12.51 TRINITY_DN1685_c0_g1_i9:155-529(+)